jgi:multiple sugar transport system substrate-binding protein
VSLPVAATILSGTATRALAADFDWKKHNGTSIKLLLSKHPYVDAMLADIENFKTLTGIDVTYDVFSQNVYYEKLTAAFSAGSTEYDAFMTGPYNNWQYGPAGWLADLNEFIGDPEKTNPAYAWDDVLPGVRSSLAWSGNVGDALGGPGSKQWAVPWGFELNNLSYNISLLEKVGVTPPKNLPELIETAAKIGRDGGGAYGIGVRGSRNESTVHPGMLSAYTNYGAKDFIFADGKLRAGMGSPESKEFHRLWVQMIKESGPRNWSNYTWYELQQDLTAGTAAIIYDADIIGFFVNGSDGPQKGNIGSAAIAPNPAMSHPTSNIWVWALGMSEFSTKKDATWLLMQWATGLEQQMFGARSHDLVNPVRNKIWEDEEFSERLSQYKGYKEQYEASAPHAQVYFTPQPLFFSTVTEWAAALQKMVAGETSVDEGLDRLVNDVNRQLDEAGL